jgi:hypothetical protein
MASYRDREEKSVTLVLIPHHGASMFQWRLPRWVWTGLILGLIALIGSAAWILGLHIHYQDELKRLHDERQAAKKAAMEIARGREAMVRVAKMEMDLRHMLKFKSDKALFNSNSVGGPSEDDVKRIGMLLDDNMDRAADKAGEDMEAMVAAAKAREDRYNELAKYVEKKRSMLAAKPTAWPVHGWISSGFGSRVSPLSGEKGYHAGLDIANDIGTPVHATADGRVAYAGWEGGYGKLVVVSHGHGFSTYYGHLSEIKAAVGQSVRRGTVIGLMGQTGDATGPHVHYEIRVFGAAVDPTKYME